MRYPDWQSRFWAALEESRTRSFVWGKNDCVLFAACMADAISDLKYAERAKQAFSWTNAREAAELLSGGSLVDLVETVLGPRHRWQSLSIGDIVAIIDDKGRESLTIHDGVQLIGPWEIGIRPIPVRYAVCGWRVE